MAVDEALVRELAYQIWEMEGRPDGEADTHWERALKLAESHSSMGASGQPEKQSAPQNNDD